MHCEQAEMKLAQYLFDEMNEAERIELEAHLDACDSCHDKVGDMRVTVGLLKEGINAQPAPVLSDAKRAALLTQLSKPITPDSDDGPSDHTTQPLAFPIPVSPQGKALLTAAGLVLVALLTVLLMPSGGGEHEPVIPVARLDKRSYAKDGATKDGNAEGTWFDETTVTHARDLDSAHRWKHTSNVNGVFFRVPSTNSMPRGESITSRSSFTAGAITNFDTPLPAIGDIPTTGAAFAENGKPGNTTADPSPDQLLALTDNSKSMNRTVPGRYRDHVSQYYKSIDLGGQPKSTPKFSPSPSQHKLNELKHTVDSVAKRQTEPTGPTVNPLADQFALNDRNSDESDGYTYRPADRHAQEKSRHFHDPDSSRLFGDNNPGEWNKNHKGRSEERFKNSFGTSKDGTQDDDAGLTNPATSPANQRGGLHLANSGKSSSESVEKPKTRHDTHTHRNFGGFAKGIDTSPDPKSGKFDNVDPRDAQYDGRAGGGDGDSPKAWTYNGPSPSRQPGSIDKLVKDRLASRSTRQPGDESLTRHAALDLYDSTSGPHNRANKSKLGGLDHNDDYRRRFDDLSLEGRHWEDNDRTVTKRPGLMPKPDPRKLTETNNNLWAAQQSGQQQNQTHQLERGDGTGKGPGYSQGQGQGQGKGDRQGSGPVSFAGNTKSPPPATDPGAPQYDFDKNWSQFRGREEYGIASKTDKDFGASNGQAELPRIILDERRGLFPAPDHTKGKRLEGKDFESRLSAYEFSARAKADSEYAEGELARFGKHRQNVSGDTGLRTDLSIALDGKEAASRKFQIEQGGDYSAYAIDLEKQLGNTRGKSGEQLFKESVLLGTLNDQAAARRGLAQKQERLQVELKLLNAKLEQSNTKLLAAREKDVEFDKKRIELEAANNEMTTQRDTLRRQVRLNQETAAAIEAELEATKQQLATLSEGIDANANKPTIMIAPAQPAVAIRGQVSAVQQAGKEITLAQINIGSTAGVKPGQEVILHRNSDYLGTLVITDVEEQKATGKLRTLRNGYTIHAGDQAIFGPIGGRAPTQPSVKTVDPKQQGNGQDESETKPDDTPLPPASNFTVEPVNPWTRTVRDRQSTFALDVDTASYALGRKYIRRGYRPPPGSVRMEEYVNAFDYNYPQKTGQTFTVFAEGAPAPFVAKNEYNVKLIKIGVRGKVIGRDKLKPAHLVFVVDTSGSMARPDRLPLVKYSLTQLVQQLHPGGNGRPADRISLVAYGSETHVLLDSVSVDESQRIITAINALQSSGATNLLRGVATGYRAARQSFQAGQINRIILCSDGIATLGETEADAMLDHVSHYRKQGISFTSVGFGTGTYNDALMEKLANKGDGSYIYVDSKREAKRVFVDELAATLQTIAKDAKIQVEFNPHRVHRYRLIGYENRAIADKDFRNDTIDAGEVGSGQSSTALYEVELEGDASAPIGTVYVRYQNVETEKVEEISYALSNDLIRDRKPASHPHFYLAACAAEFAELMRESEHTTDGSLKRLEFVLQPVVEQLPLDQKAKELMSLVRKAQTLPKAP